MALRSTYSRCRFWKKSYFFRWISFWSWRVRKQAKLSHLGHGKPASIHWKADAPKTSYCLVRILIQRAIFLWNWPLQSMTIVIGPCWTNFCSQKLKRKILATFGFNRTVEATLYVLRPVFEDHIISRRADDICHRLGAFKDKCYSFKPETIYALKDNIREAIV